MPAGDGQRLYRTLVALCAREWRISPFQVKQMARRRQFVMADVLDLIRLAAMDVWNGPGLIQHIAPKSVEKARRRVVQEARSKRHSAAIAQLVALAKGQPPAPPENPAP